jgi:prepilin-type processing-associated H-X9-DG protein
LEIAGIGTAVPPNRIHQVDATAISKKFAHVLPDQERIFESLYRRSGVATRHSVVLDSSEGELDSRQSFYGENSPSTEARMKRYEVEATTLALQASEMAIGDSSISSKQITHLITVSCSGFHAPGFDIALAKRLPLRSDIARTHIGFMGCQGALNGLRVAHAFTKADPRACVLLCATELCSLHHYYGWDPEKIVANALFADGSAAVVLTGSEFRSANRAPRIVATGSTLIENSEDAMSWRIGDHGFEMTLSARVPGLISETLRPWLDNWLADHSQTIASIGSWAVHPGGPRILAAFGEAVGIPRESLAPSYEILAEYGNMSSATVLFILKRLLQNTVSMPTLAVAFGPGLTVEAVLMV